jgi:hypothetical protein
MATDKEHGNTPTKGTNRSETPGFSLSRLTSPMVLYALSGTNTIDCKPIFISDQTIQWEISPRYLAYCLEQMYDYNETIHVWVKTGAEVLPEKKKKKPKKKYKPVADRVHLVPATLPEEFRIVRHFPSDPLEDMPKLNLNPGELQAGERYTLDQTREMEINKDRFLLPEEEKLVHKVILNHEMVFAWDKTKEGISERTTSNW